MKNLFPKDVILEMCLPMLIFAGSALIMFYLGHYLWGGISVALFLLFLFSFMGWIISSFFVQGRIVTFLNRNEGEADFKEIEEYMGGKEAAQKGIKFLEDKNIVEIDRESIRLISSNVGKGLLYRFMKRAEKYQ